MTFRRSLDRDEQQLYEMERAALEATGLSRREAEKSARERVEQGISRAKAGGLYQAAPIGEAVLQHYKNDPEESVKWEALQKEGVTEEDLIRWWNLHPVERELVLIDDEAARLGTWLSLIDQGQTPDQASRNIWKSFAMFGDYLAKPTFPEEPSSVMLPGELKDRVNRWLEKISTEKTPDEVRAEAAQFGTMNGYVRHLICRGEI
jgi:hypothetical protein